MSEENTNVVQKKAGKYNYLLIRFTKRGPKTGLRYYDLVPSSWVYVSKKTGKLVVKFMPPPYIGETLDLLYHLVQNLSDPIADWPEYNVQVKGGAGTFEEAEKRLDVFNSKEYAFTTDADETPEEKASQIVNQLKQTKLKVSAETEAALQVPELISENEEDSLSEETVNSAHNRFSSKHKGNQALLLDDNDATSSVSKVTDQNGNLKLRDKNKKKTDKTACGSNIVDKNVNQKLKDLKKKAGPNEKSIEIDTNDPSCIQFSTSKSNKATSLDENSSSNEESYAESAVRTSFTGHSRLSVDEVYSDSENEGHIDNIRTVDSVGNRRLQLPKKNDLLKTLERKNSVPIHNKPPKQKPEKTGQKSSKFCDGPSSKPKISEDKNKPARPSYTQSKSNVTKTASYSTNLKQKSSKIKEHMSKEKITPDSELLWEIYAGIQIIKVDIQEINTNQTREKELRHTNTVEQGIQENFISKHNLKLPFKDIEAFDEFNSNLLSKDDLRQEFMKSLIKLFDRDNVASKTVTNILRKYLSRKMAMQHTAIKKMPDKLLMKDTAFYDCLLGVVTETHRDKRGDFITESGFASILGNSLGNAKDWEGKRKRKNRGSDLDEVDEVEETDEMGVVDPDRSSCELDESNN